MSDDQKWPVVEPKEGLDGGDFVEHSKRSDAGVVPLLVIPDGYEPPNAALPATPPAGQAESPPAED